MNEFYQILKSQMDVGIVREPIKVIHLQMETDNSTVIYSTQRISAELGFGKRDQVLISTASSEVSTNILRYAGSGIIEINRLTESLHNNVGIEIIAVDEGPGISDIELALQEGFTTRSQSLGLGLPACKRIMSWFQILSDSKNGTCILMSKWLKDGNNRV